MHCPCHECKSREPVCHDRCEEYLNWHDELVDAKAALDRASIAIDFARRAFERREKKLRAKR